jgi:hypothetical protein
MIEEVDDYRQVNEADLVEKKVVSKKEIATS